MDITLSGVELDCEFEYTPAEGDGFHNQRFEEEVVLISAKVADVDISALLSDAQIKTLEEKALAK